MYREAQIMRILDHPNIIKLFEVMETKKNLFLILEYAPKGEFLEYIITNGKVDEDEAKRFTKQIIAALVRTIIMARIITRPCIMSCYHETIS